MFDKMQYRINRQMGKRGQGGMHTTSRGVLFLRRDRNGQPIPAKEGGLPIATVGGKPVSVKALRKNTKRARKAALNG